MVDQGTQPPRFEVRLTADTHWGWIRTRLSVEAVRLNRLSSSSSGRPRSGRASSLQSSRTPRARSASQRVGRPGWSQKRRDPPKRASHPPAEAAGGMGEF